MAEREQTGIIIKQNRALHAFAEGLVFGFVSGSSVEGAENMVYAERLLQLGVPVEFWFAPHGSHADYTLLHKAQSITVSSAFAHDTYGAMGSMLDKTKITKILKHAYNGFMVPSVRDLPTTKEGREERNGQKEVVFDVAEELHATRKAIGLNPEGTRLGGKELRRGVAGVGRYPRTMNSGVIIPVAIEGAIDILGQGSKFPRRGPATLKCGKPVWVGELLDRAKGFPTREGDQLMVDTVMLEIANLLPEKYRGAYNGFRKN